MKSKNFIIKNNSLPYDVMVSIGESPKSLKRRLKKFGISKKERVGAVLKSKVSLGTAAMFKDGQSLIILDKNPLPGTIAHEAFHVTTFIMKRVGIKLKVMTSCEAYAYMIDFIVREIHENLE